LQPAYDAIAHGAVEAAFAGTSEEQEEQEPGE
jgi:hypothetical protein